MLQAAFSVRACSHGNAGTSGPAESRAAPAYYSCCRRGGFPVLSGEMRVSRVSF